MKNMLLIGTNDPMYDDSIKLLHKLVYIYILIKKYVL